MFCGAVKNSTRIPVWKPLARLMILYDWNFHTLEFSANLTLAQFYLVHCHRLRKKHYTPQQECRVWWRIWEYLLWRQRLQQSHLAQLSDFRLGEFWYHNLCNRMFTRITRIFKPVMGHWLVQDDSKFFNNFEKLLKSVNCSYCSCQSQTIS